MKTDSHMDELKKETPFRIPEKFFEDITGNTLKRAKARNRKKNILISVSAAASFMLLLVGAGSMYLHVSNSTHSGELVYEDIKDTVFITQNNIPAFSESEANMAYHSFSSPEIESILSEISDTDLEAFSEIMDTDLFFVEL